jgi:hypothetical protein
MIPRDPAWRSAEMSEPTPCPRCHGPVEEPSDFCPHCGTLLIEGERCSRHGDRPAAGACVICSEAACEECGRRVGGLFLCEEHREYEIYEGLARVYGTSDPAQAEYVQACLAQAGLHPFLYSRKSSPLSLGGPDYMLFRASGEYDGHIINEVKVMVPCQEFESAESVIADVEAPGGE